MTLLPEEYRVSLVLIVGKILVPVALMTPAVLAPVAANATTPLELGLAERACGMAPYSSVTESDAEKPCVSTQLAALRADFGPNLTGLSPRERRGLDGACSRMNTPLARDRYLDCLNTELEMMRSRRKQASAAAGGTTQDRSAVHTTSARREPPAFLTLVLVVGGIAVVVAAGGVAFLIVRRRSAQIAPTTTSAASA